MDESPNYPRGQSAHLDLPALQYGKALAHYGHGALIEVAKRSWRLAAGYTAVNEFSCIMSLLYSHLGDAGKGFAVLLECRGIANHKDFGMSGDSQIFLNAYPPGTVRLHVKPLARRRRRDTGGPDYGLARNALTCHHYAVCVDLIHAVSESNLDAEILKSLFGSLREVLRERSENSRCHIEKHNSSRGRVN